MATIEQQLNQLTNDKKTLANNLVTQGVEATEDETFTSLVPKVLDIETGGGDVKINNASYLFYGGYRSDQVEELCNMINPDCTDFNRMFYTCNNLTTIPLINTSKGTDFSYMFAAFKSLTTIPLIDTSNGTNFSGMFRETNGLKTIPLIDTSKGTDFSSMFEYSYITTIPLINTSKGTDFSSMFGSSKFTTIPLIDTSNGTRFDNMFSSTNELESVPVLNTSKGTSFSYMFNYAKKLGTIPSIDTSNGTNFSYMCRNCTNLTDVPLLDMSKSINNSNMFASSTALTNLAGFKDLGKSYTQKSSNYNNYKLTLSASTNLTHDSLMNVINNLYDLNLTYNVAGGGTLYQQALTLGSTNLAKLTPEEIAIATNKGWTVS